MTLRSLRSSLRSGFSASVGNVFCKNININNGRCENLCVRHVAKGAGRKCSLIKRYHSYVRTIQYVFLAGPLVYCCVTFASEAVNGVNVPVPP